MIEVLAAIGGGGTLLFGVAFVVLTFASRKDARELLAARDMLDQEREETRHVRGELATEQAGHEATQKKLDAEKQLRARVEAQRNEALRRLRALVPMLKKGSVADAISTIDALLADAGGAPGDVSDGVPETVPAGDPNRTDDDLIDPRL